MPPHVLDHACLVPAQAGAAQKLVSRSLVIPLLNRIKVSQSRLLFPARRSSSCLHTYILEAQPHCMPAWHKYAHSNWEI